jgi:hypothetical protein
MSARVEDVTDNIAESQPVAETSQSAPTQAAPELYNLAQAFRLIAEKYSDRKFDKINVITPPQIVDGGLMEFADTDGKFLAAARTRFRNKIVINDQSGDLLLLCQLSDLSFNATVLPISITDKPAEAPAAEAPAAEVAEVVAETPSA